MADLPVIPAELWIKGPPKRQWRRHRRLVEFIFTRLFPHWDYRSAQVAMDAGVKKSTVYGWLTQWKVNSKWRPYKTYRSKEKRLFTDAEEEAIADHIINVYIAAGVYFGDEEFRDVAVEAWLRKKGRDSQSFLTSSHTDSRSATDSALAAVTPKGGQSCLIATRTIGR